MHVRERFIDKRHRLDNGKYHQRQMKVEKNSQYEKQNEGKQKERTMGHSKTFIQNSASLCMAVCTSEIESAVQFVF